MTSSLGVPCRCTRLQILYYSILELTLAVGSGQFKNRCTFVSLLVTFANGVESSNQAQ